MVEGSILMSVGGPLATDGSTSMVDCDSLTTANGTLPDDNGILTVDNNTQMVDRGILMSIGGPQATDDSTWMVDCGTQMTTRGTLMDDGDILTADDSTRIIDSGIMMSVDITQTIDDNILVSAGGTLTSDNCTRMVIGHAWIADCVFNWDSDFCTHTEKEPCVLVYFTYFSMLMDPIY
jgi:hypothetical protein